MLRECCKDIPNVEVDSFNGLTVQLRQAETRHRHGARPAGGHRL